MKSLPLLLAAVLLALAQQVSAQHCHSLRRSTTVQLTAGRVQHASASEIEGWAIGARVARQVAASLAVGVWYRHAALTGAAMHIAGFSAATGLGLPGRPCLTLEVLAATGASLATSDAYRNVTAPLGLVFSRSGTIAPHAGVQVIYSATSARLLSYSMRRFTLGYGLLGGARLHSGRLLIDLNVNATNIGRSVGPQPLGRFRADLSFGLRL